MPAELDPSKLSEIEIIKETAAYRLALTLADIQRRERHSLLYREKTLPRGFSYVEPRPFQRHP